MYSTMVSKPSFASTVKWAMNRHCPGEALSHFDDSNNLLCFLRPSNSRLYCLICLTWYLYFLTFDSAAFSMPEMNVEYNASSENLRCEAPRWFPQPTVVWASQVNQGANFSEVSNTSFELNSENVTMKVVSVLYNVTINNTYSCMIENNIAKATGDIKVTGGFIQCFFPLWCRGSKLGPHTS